MTFLRSNLVLLSLFYALAALPVLVGVNHVTSRIALTSLQDTGLVRLEQAADRLLGQLEPYQQLPTILAKHPTVIAALDPTGPSVEINDFLLDMALATGSDGIYLLNLSGRVIASSNFQEPESFIGTSYATRPDVQDALNGVLGFYHALETADMTRDFFYTRGVIKGAPPALGTIVVKVNVTEIEFEWNIDENVIAIFDENDIAFVTNRPDLILARLPGAPPIDPRQFPPEVIRPFVPITASTRLGHIFWTPEGSDVFPPRSMVLSRDIPQIDMLGRIFISTTNAFAAARQQTLLVAALLGLIGMGLFMILLNRRRLSDRLVLEAEANTKLEARVTQRTQQLEVAQDELVQASKLAALGQMSAGISHELNQPLATIQILSENAKKLHDRARYEEASENLTEISAQTNRISRIIKNLRGFARKETIRIETVDFQAVLDEAINMSQQRLTDDGITLLASPPADIPNIKGGQIRLQQVIHNILTNACDALRDQTAPEIHLTFSHTKTTVTLEIRDNGPGLSDPAKVFEPFFTTKEIGASKGLGLGLSISHGIIGSLGGTLSASNTPNGGAAFQIILNRADIEEPT